MSYFSYFLPQQWRTRSEKPSLMWLPDDLLLMVLDILHGEGRNPQWTENQSLHKLLALQAVAAQTSFKAFLAFSSTNWRMRALAAPKLHREIHLGPSWGTERLQRAISDIGSNFNALTYARELNIDLWKAASATGNSETLFASLLALVIPTFAQLSKLTITVPEGSAAAFQIAFEKSEEQYSRITELKLSPHMGWLIKLCPNVRSVSTNDWIMSYAPPARELAFVDEAATAPLLEHFSIHARWSKHILVGVLERLPHVKSLAFPGGSLLPELLPHLRKHKNLERLELVHAQRLSNAMPMTPVLQLARARSRDQRLPSITWYQEVITRMIFTELPRLKQLALGHDFKAVAVQNDDTRGTFLWESSVTQGFKGPSIHAWFSRKTGELCSET